MAKRLLYFTSSFPYGPGESWKSNDLMVFSNYFDRVILQPLTYGNSRLRKGMVPEGVEVMAPLFESDNEMSKVNSRFELILNTIFDLRTIRELTSSFPLDKRKLISTLNSALQGKRIAEKIRRLYFSESTDASDTTLFFFWGLGAVESLPWLSEAKSMRVVVGYHRYDLYEECAGTREFPFRRQQLKLISFAAPCSRHGVLHMQEKFPTHKNKIVLRTLGTHDVGLAKWSPARSLRILSCSNCSPVKRLPLLIEGLSKVKSPIEWTHVGGGVELESTKQLAEKALSSDRVAWKITGAMTAAEVRSFITANEFDLLLNTSESEGLPVSMMEALCAGIPVIATDVGGVSEIVDDSVGLLLPANPTGEQIAAAIDDFSSISADRAALLRKNARARYEQNFKAPDTIADFADRVFGGL